MAAIKTSERAGARAPRSRRKRSSGAFRASLPALAEPLRWRIVQLLANEELCVCHLVEELDVAQSLVSHHLKVLHDAGVVTSERWSYWTYYRLVPDALHALAIGLTELAGAARRGAERRPCC
jgi:ArsR family transcriptional regulator, arsenate/arsenite/antimonite-responsive transcriptional repressor